MNLGERNREYWQKYEAGTTPGMNETPPDELLRSLPIGAHILDVGTGTGRLAESLAAQGFSVDAIDINEHEIAANTQRTSSVRYSVQDVTTTTGFPAEYFDLILFRYTLTNIHKDQWHALSNELQRITKPDSYVWLAEPGVNDAYAARYELGSQSLGDRHALYVFKDKTLAAKVQDTTALQKAVAQDQIARIVRHYDERELTDLFPAFAKIDGKHVNDTSPSGYPLETIVMTLQKAQ